LKNNILQHYKK